MAFGEQGDRVRLICMADDPDPVPPGTEGTIVFVDSAQTRHVDWDNGRSVGLIPNSDNWELIESNPVDPDHMDDTDSEYTDDGLRETDYP